MTNPSDGHDNSAWHMLPRGAQNAWRNWAKRAASTGQPQTTSAAFAAGVWWAMTEALKEAAVLLKERESKGHA